MKQNTLRRGAALAITSIIIAAVATSFHGGTDPSNLQVVLPEYAANPNWKAAHLGEFIGYMAMLGSLAILLSYIKEKSGSIFALLGLIAATVAASTYAANHAVDGVAIRYVAEAWVNAPPEEKTLTFRVAETVRHIEQGLSGLAALNLGITLLLGGFAIISSHIFTKWFGWAALLVGSSYLVSGVSLYYLGFSQHVLSFWTGILLLIWLMVMALLLWRESQHRVSERQLAERDAN